MKQLDERLGTITIEPAGAVTAGTMMEWTLTFTAGSYGVDEGGTLMLVQRIAADMQKPQFDYPDQAAFTTVTTNAACRLAYRFQTKQHARPWQKWCLVIDVMDGSISPGETITIVLGDRSQGSPGIRAQSFVETGHEFRILLDPTNAAAPRRLPSSPIVPIVAGEPVKIECIVPAQLGVTDEARVLVKGIDVWGNPTVCPNDVHLAADRHDLAAVDETRIKALAPGIVYVKARCEDMVCRSNPLEIVTAESRFCRYWGDMHAQTDSTVGTGSEEEYFTFAKNRARLDFVGHQGNDFQLTDEDWSRLNRVVKAHNRPGEFVILPGFEWSGNTSAGGDHNVFYSEDDQPLFRSSHWQVPEVPEDEMTPAHPADDLFAKLKKNGNAMVVPHIGGRPANVGQYFDPEIEHVVEILSCHGMFEWLLWDALELGYKVGVVCNSDGHKGRPGAEGPGAGMFGIAGGLTCVLAKELTRASIFQALKARRCYGTTGARMLLDFEANGHLMGEEFTTGSELAIRASVHGSAPIESLSLLNGKRVVTTKRAAAFTDLHSSNRIRISWEGARIRGRARRAVWDGTIEANGTRIDQVTTYAFDSPADGITSRTDSRLTFKSTTAGDSDGVDLILSSAAQGTITFQSGIGSAEIDLSMLGSEPEEFPFGGLDLKLVVQRYPERLESTFLAMELALKPPKGVTTPYLVKAIQEDGQIAWSSPIYVTGT